MPIEDAKHRILAILNNQPHGNSPKEIQETLPNLNIHLVIRALGSLLEEEKVELTGNKVILKLRN